MAKQPKQEPPEPIKIHPLEKLLLKIQIWQARYRIEMLKRKRKNGQ